MIGCCMRRSAGLAIVTTALSHLFHALQAEADVRLVVPRGQRSWLRAGEGHDDAVADWQRRVIETGQRSWKVDANIGIGRCREENLEQNRGGIQDQRRCWS